MNIQLSMTFLVRGDSELDQHTDEVFEELLRLEAADKRLSDSDMDAVLEDSLVTIRLVAEAETFDAGLDLASSSIRAAIHAAGGATPGWENHFTEPHSVAYELRDQTLIPA